MYAGTPHGDPPTLVAEFESFGGWGIFTDSSTATVTVGRTYRRPGRRILVPTRPHRSSWTTLPGHPGPGRDGADPGRPADVCIAGSAGPQRAAHRSPRRPVPVRRREGFVSAV